MPEDMTFRDARAGTDVELGLSIYEPFGISQLEPLCFGALCAVSNVCGCTGFARRAAAGQGGEGNVLEANFTALDRPMGIPELLGLTVSDRDRIEASEAACLAEIIAERLPRDDKTLQARIASGQALADRMSWERVVEDYFLPNLTRVAH
jgi:glycogen synthase